MDRSVPDYGQDSWTMVKIHLFFLLSAIAKHSEEGYQAVIAGLDRYKVMKCLVPVCMQCSNVCYAGVAREACSTSVQPAGPGIEQSLLTPRVSGSNHGLHQLSCCLLP